MNRTALLNKHRELDAKIVDFHGWEMPLHYKEGIVSEHIAVRNKLGIFDVSHMGDLLIYDDSEGDETQSLLTNNIINLKIGKGAYTHLTDEEGRIIDDLIITKLTEDTFFCVPNASMTEIVKDWMIGKSSIKIKDVTNDLSCIAVQGPDSVESMLKLFGENVREIKRFSIAAYDFKEKSFTEINQINYQSMKSDIGIISRTGYTGEEGFEIIVPNDFVEKIWDYFINISAQPVGLGARDTLRLEMGYLLSGQDFNRDRTPIETNCAWVVKWDHNFIGKEKLLELKESGSYQRMIGISLGSKAPARPGSLVRLPDSPHEIVGSVSSGNFSPSLQHPIALAYVNREHHESEKEVILEHRGRHLKGITTKTPFIKKK